MIAAIIYFVRPVILATFGAHALGFLASRFIPEGLTLPIAKPAAWIASCGVVGLLLYSKNVHDATRLYITWVFDRKKRSDLGPNLAYLFMLTCFCYFFSWTLVELFFFPHRSSAGPTENFLVKLGFGLAINGFGWLFVTTLSETALESTTERKVND